VALEYVCGVEWWWACFGMDVSTVEVMVGWFVYLVGLVCVGMIS
jgi:hypothetical protein